jgi:hypothetical protein
MGFGTGRGGGHACCAFSTDGSAASARTGSDQRVIEPSSGKRVCIKL